jgi:dipeptidase E
MKRILSFLTRISPIGLVTAAKCFICQSLCARQTSHTIPAIHGFDLFLLLLIPAISPFDATYIGGGNTFSLFSELLESGFAEALREYATQGGAIYGGSAGAVILGRDLLTVEHMDANDVGLSQRTGLDLAGGHAVWVHYTPQDDCLIDQYIHQSHFPILAIPEQAGVLLEGNELMSIGRAPVYRFAGNTKEQIL